MLLMIAIAAAMVLLVMFVLWLIHLKIKNAAIVDVGWAGNFALIALIFLLMADGYYLRKILIASMAILWSIRLTFYLFQRTVGHGEEGRYRQLRKSWGANIAMKFLLFFLFQGILNLLFSLPFLLASINPDPSLSAWEYLGMFIWLIALVGESLADAQLKRFKSNPHNQGKVCQIGLWQYSRHPNYFFEWLIWVAFFLFALTSPYGFITIICPALILFFLFKVTGIPATEEQALRTKGESYKEYQRTTSAFVPWFPKTSGHEAR